MTEGQELAEENAKLKKMVFNLANLNMRQEVYGWASRVDGQMEWYDIADECEKVGVCVRKFGESSEQWLARAEEMGVDLLEHARYDL